MKKICIIGSINMDLVASVDKFPKPGETVVGKGFGTYPGGKGANQAVAAGRLGADVQLIGKVGNDLYGKQYIETLKNNNVGFEGVEVQNGISTGIAIIEVDKGGENHIVIIPGANNEVSMDYIKNKMGLISQYDIFLLQLEIPTHTVINTIKLLKDRNKTIILDPAPAKILPGHIYKYVDYITPNETELEFLTGIKIDNPKNIETAANLLIAKGVKSVIAKAGKKGCFACSSNYFIHIPGFKVKSVDTTAAGDSFNAGFAFSLAEEKELKECLRFANATGALATTAKGAQEAMPTYEKIKKFIREESI